MNAPAMVPVLVGGLALLAVPVAVVVLVRKSRRPHPGQ